MNPKDPTLRYLLNVLIFAAAYVVVASIFFPGDSSVLALVGKGLLTGAIAQHLTDWRERRVSEGKTPYHPELRIWGGAIGLGFTVWCFTQHKAEDPWFLLLFYAALAVFCLRVVVRAVQEARRGDAPPSTP